MRDPRASGWIVGLGLVPASWVAAGVISTFTPEPESAFPYVLAAAFGVAVVGVAVLASRVAEMRSTLLAGAAISVAMAASVWGLIVAFAP